jgi:hypothetical protein
MNMMVKNIIFSLCVLSSFQLFSMEIESCKKSDDGWFRNPILFCKGMQRYGDEKHIGIPQDVALVIAQQSYLLRTKEVYEKFDPFFHFNNKSYHAMKPEWDKNRNKFRDESLNTDNPAKRYSELYHNFYLTRRRFDIIQPNDLLFFTQKQDEILSSLLFTKKQDGILCLSEPRLKPFFSDKDDFSLQLTFDENEQYEMLPNEFKKKLEKYPKFVSPKNLSSKSISNETIDFDERF